MDNNKDTSLDRRLFLGGMALMAMLQDAHAQRTKGAGEPVKLSPLIADFVTGFDLKAAPPRAIEQARLAFIDTVGVMLAGSRSEPAHIICEMVRAEEAKPTASVAGQSLRTSPQLAALANGVAGHALDFDFTYMQGQLLAPVIPALLPLAEATGATPAETLAAFIVGFEIVSRLSRTNPDHNGVGAWHGTSTIGTIGAAVVCARLLKVKAAAVPDVIGISVSMASGVNANYGTMTKPLHAGHAARNGVVAALLGSRGFTANGAAIEGRGGFAKTFARGLTWNPQPFADLGRQWDIAERGIRPKRYPCGGVIHTGIDAALALRERLGPRVAEITAIKAGISRYAASRAGEQYPASSEAAKFNLQYVVAYALAHGVPKLAAFDEAAIREARVKELAGMITTEFDAEFADATGGDYPTRLTLTLRDGSTQQELCLHASGTRQNPMSLAQMEEKFLDCAAQAVAPAAAQKILSVLKTLDERPSFADLWPLLRT